MKPVYLELTFDFRSFRYHLILFKNILNEFCKFTLFRLVNIIKHSLFVSDFVVFLHIGALGVCESEQLQFFVPFVARPSVGANYDNDNTYANSIKTAISDIIFAFRLPISRTLKLVKKTLGFLTHIVFNPFCI